MKSNKFKNQHATCLNYKFSFKKNFQQEKKLLIFKKFLQISKNSSGLHTLM